LIRSGAFDGLDKKGTAFHELSRSRLGYYGDPEMAEKVFKELKKRKLAEKSKDGISIPMHSGCSRYDSGNACTNSSV
jgi:hypothetical protein